MSRWVACWLALALHSVAGSNASGFGATFVELGDLPGAPDEVLHVAGVSTDGNTMFATGTGAAGARAFRWTASGGTVVVDDLDSRAEWMSRDGRVLLYSRIHSDRSYSLCRWTVTGGVEVLWTWGAATNGQPAAQYRRVVHDATSDGSVILGVVPSGVATSPGSFFVWSSTGGLRHLAGFSSAFALSDDGTVALGEWMGSGSDSGLIRIEAGADGDLGTGDDLPVSIAARGSAAWMSGDARSVIWRELVLFYPGPTFFERAHRWSIGPDDAAGTSDDMSEDLSSLGGTPDVCRVYGANADARQAAGWCAVPPMSLVRWAEGIGWDRPVPVPSDAHAAIAHAISDDGSVVAGVAEPPLAAIFARLPVERTAFSASVDGRVTWLNVNVVFPADESSTNFGPEIRVSGDGSTIVGVGDSGLGRSIFRWRTTTGLEWIAELPESGTSSHAIAIAPDGRSVIGTATASDGDRITHFGLSGIATDSGAPIGGFQISLGSSAASSALTGNLRGGAAVPEPWVWSALSGLVEPLGPEPVGWGPCVSTHVSDDAFHVTGHCSESVPASGGLQFNEPAARTFVWNRSRRAIEVLVSGPGIPSSAVCTAVALSSDGSSMVENCRAPYGPEISIAGDPLGSFYRRIDIDATWPIVRTGAPTAPVSAAGATLDGATVVGTEQRSDQQNVVFRWSPATGWHDVESGPDLRALDLSRGGSFVLMAGAAGSIGVRGWGTNGGTQWVSAPGLCTTPCRFGDAFLSSARLSADGRVAALSTADPLFVVGGWLLRRPGENLFVLDRIHGVRRVESDLLGGEQGTLTLRDISTDGRRIVGNATQGARSFGWLLTLPDVGDFDRDGIDDTADDCPSVANPDQRDRGGVGAVSAPDGVGDACQCGDVNDDGRVTLADAAMLSRALLTSPMATLARPERCDVGGTAGCGMGDAVVMRRALLSPPTASIAAQCVARLP